MSEGEWPLQVICLRLSCPTNAKPSPKPGQEEDGVVGRECTGYCKHHHNNVENEEGL